MENMIVMLKVDELFPHPNNPRKNVGDVTELAESIRESGIMQNLTVVPMFDGAYTVVIGHRRLAAAKVAGLSEVPCVIKEMTPAQQLATMLAENVQRNDLTPLEQAEGIQMMFDIGESVADVVAKTGLSESTVRRRARMLEMNIDALREAEGRGASLADYERLNQIEDIEERNEVLKHIGTNNFNYNLESTLRRQRERKNKESIIALLATFAEKTDGRPKDGKWITTYYPDKDETSIKIPEDSDTEKYMYEVGYYGISLYKIIEEEESEEDIEEKNERLAKMQRESERKEKLMATAEQAYKCRRKFIEEFNPGPRHGREIKRFLWNMLVFAGEYINEKDIDELCGTAFSDGGSYEDMTTMADEYFDNNTDKAMLQMAYLWSGDHKRAYVNWDGSYNDEETCADKLYECLERLGYQMSDTEKELQNGTHELFSKE